MSKTCDICGGKIGMLHSFHCQDGTICKTCYKIVSGNYTSTITGRTLLELKQLYIQNAPPLELGEEGFQATQRIGSFLLLDSNSRKLCILNNRKLTHQNTRPEFFPYESLKSFALVTEPTLSSLTPSEDTVVQKMAVRLDLEGVGEREIVIIPTPVRTSSFAFRQGRKVAQKILDCLSDI